MANKKQKKSWGELISATKGGKEIGKFDESTGGGTPMEKGETIDYVADNPQEAETYKKDNPNAIVRVKQPRDKGGKFTYNSANRRPLKFGPSRGKTVPPFLLGAKLTFAKKSGKGAFVTEEGKKYSLPDNIKSDDEFIEIYKDVKNWLSGDAKGKGGRTGNVTEFDEDYMRNKYSSSKKKYGGRKTKIAKKKADADTEQTTTPKADSPKADTQPTPQVGNKDGVDYSLAKSDPNKFMTDNYDELSSLKQLAQDNGFNLNVKKVVGAIASGQFNSFEEIRKTIEGNK